MNWALLIGGLGALYGFCLYVIAPDREFRQEMTRAEKAAVANGQTVTKIQKGSAVLIGHNKSYNQGPLRIKPGKNGKAVFEPFGTWKQVRSNGELMAEWTYTGVARETVERIYHPDGSLDVLSYTVPAILNGDSVRETRLVYFVFGQPTDTLAVHHWFLKNGKEVKTSWSYDAQGRRTVPEGWKFQRF